MTDMNSMPLDELATSLRESAQDAFDKKDMVRGMVFNVLAGRFRQAHDKITCAETALEQLARLGNEPSYGNSNGNVIAQDALKKMRAEDSDG